MSLISTLIADASAFAPLAALLKTGTGPFRMTPEQIDQGTVLPAVAIQLISNPSDYVINARLATSTARVQATVFGLPPGGESARAVGSAWTQFLDQFNGIGIPNLPIYPNRVVNVREWGIPKTQPLTFLITVDAMIFYNLQQV